MISYQIPNSFRLVRAKPQLRRVEVLSAKHAASDEESLEFLEKQVLAKYGSKIYKDAFLEFDDVDDEVDSRADRLRKQEVKKAPYLKMKRPASGSIDETKDDADAEFFKNSRTLDTSASRKRPLLKPVGDPFPIRRATTLLGRLKQKREAKDENLTCLSVSKIRNDRGLIVDEESDVDSISFDVEDEEQWANEDLNDSFEIPDPMGAPFKGFGKPEEYRGPPMSRIRSSNNADSEARSGPLNAPQGYRLRPPVVPAEVVEAEKKAKQDAKAAAIAEKDARMEAKRRELKAAEKSDFFAFQFGEVIGTNDTEENGASQIDEDLFTVNTFTDVGVSNEIVSKNLERMGIFNPTTIQAAAIPEMMACRDVVVQATTGSGKTLSFLLPLLNVIDPNKRKVQAIVIAPSRELVTQIGIVADSVFRGTDIGVLSLIGGANVQNQIKRLREDRPQIVVATPGRLAELMFRLEKINLGMVRAIVIDEADNLLKEPYRGEVQTILEAIPMFARLQQDRERDERSKMGLLESRGEDQDDIYEHESMSIDDMGTGDKRFVCLASATGNDPIVRSFANQFLRPNWKYLSAAGATDMLPRGITHGLISTPRVRALEMLRKFLNAKPAIGSAIIFVNEPHKVEIVADKLFEMGLVAAPLHGESSKDDRKEILSRLRDGRLKLVVSTELAARGIDIPNLTHVVNFELPTDAQHYVHRAGRCGRAGRKGLVMNFANAETKFVIRRFGKQLNVKVLDCEIREGQVFLKRK